MKRLKKLRKKWQVSKMRDKCVEMSDNANKMRDRLIELLQKRSCFYNKSKCNSRCSNCDYVTIDDNDIGKLADHILANSGIVLPCKVGDTVYFIIDDEETEEGKYISKQQINDVSTKVIFVSDSLTEENCGIFIPFSDFGKTAFLSEEEAERALKGGEE